MRIEFSRHDGTRVKALALELGDKMVWPVVLATQSLNASFAGLATISNMSSYLGGEIQLNLIASHARLQSQRSQRTFDLRH